MFRSFFFLFVCFQSIHVALAHTTMDYVHRGHPANKALLRSWTQTISWKKT